MNQYEELIVESYEPDFNSGFHGKVHIRPVEDSFTFKRNMHVECSNELKNTSVYPLGTKFKIKGKLKKPRSAEGRICIYSHHSNPIVVVK